MPGATLPNISIILPSLGGDTGIWDDELNAALTLLDAHDHSSGKGVAVPTSGMNINADLTFAGFGATNLGKAAFSAVTALAAGSKTLFVSSADNELYWRTNAGTNVKLTNGASINTSLVGGIVGDYASVGAAVAYDDANDRYTFKQQSGTWARLASGPVRIFEFNTTETVYVELAVAAALASSYTATFPAALPVGDSFMQISSAGAITFSPTVAFASTFSATLTATALITSNTAITTTGSGTMTSAGLITASAGLTCAAGQSVTVSGAGVYKHGSKTRIIGGAAWQEVVAGAPTSTRNAGGGTFVSSITSAAGVSVFVMTVPVHDFERITDISFWRHGDGAVDITNAEVFISSNDGTGGSKGSTTVSNLAASWIQTTVPLTDTTLTNLEELHLVVTTNAANASLGGVQVTYNVP